MPHVSAAGSRIAYGETCKSVERWKRQEAEACKAIGARHRGGPGEPDCERGKVPIEVKNWKRPLGPADVLRIAADPKYDGGPLIICAPRGGFTSAAVETADNLGIRLKRCKSRKKR